MKITIISVILFLAVILGGSFFVKNQNVPFLSDLGRSIYSDTSHEDKKLSLLDTEEVETSKKTTKDIIEERLKEGRIQAHNSGIKSVLTNARNELGTYKYETGTYADSSSPEKCNQQIILPFIDSLITKYSVPLSEISCNVSPSGTSFTFYSGLLESEEIICVDSQIRPRNVSEVYETGISCHPISQENLEEL